MRKKNAKLKTIPWDAAQYLKTDEDIAEYLDAVFEDGDPELIRHALGDIAAQNEIESGMRLATLPAPRV